IEMSSTRRGARCALAAATAWAALMAAPASAQSDIPLQPFPVNHESRIDSGADARFLLDGPAGKYGLIAAKIGRAACRERVCQYGWISGGADQLKKKSTNK